MSQTPQRLIRVGWLIDGLGGAIRRDVTLGVADGKIVSITETADQRGDEPHLDLSRATILPHLIDSHIHLWLSASTDPEYRARQCQATPEAITAQIKQNLGYLLAHGVVVARDLGDRHGLALAESRRFTDAPTRIIASGPGWHQNGRYGTLFAHAPETGETLVVACRRGDDGAPWLKIFQSGANSLKIFGQAAKPQFSAEEMRAATAWAHSQGKKVAVHANGAEAAHSALTAGCDSIEHGYFIGEENLREMARRGVVWAPTLVPMRALADYPGLSPAERAIAAKNLAHQIEQVRLGRKLGVQIVCGTDAGCTGVICGDALREELALLMKAGFSLAEAVKSATSDAASLLGLPGFSLAPGQPADFLVVRASPAQLPRKLFFIDAIYRNGEADRRFHAPIR
ncbi:MAG: amidohydrolase family protein [Desulfobulbaceae bacterium]|jgi:imidazolonepropionase-like amidohydrolase|nr:amidohydrolase family protein [Desulfobulbaceae bacterium]